MAKVNCKTLFFLLTIFISTPFAFSKSLIFTDSFVSRFPISYEDLSEIHLTDNRKLAIVIGGGPAGLMSALTLRNDGFNVVVLEKRPPEYTRLNILGLKVESEIMLRELGVFDEFLENVGTHLKARRVFELAKGKKKPKRTTEIKNIPEPGSVSYSDFISEPIDEKFKDGAQYLIITGEFEQFLAEKARERGISIINNARTTIQKAENHFNVKVAQEENVIEFLAPDIIVLADGSKGPNAVDGFNPKIHHKDHPSEGEQWIFGDFQYLGNKSFNTGLIDWTIDGSPRLVNAHFDHLHKRVGITVMVLESDISNQQSYDLLHHYAKIIFDAENIRTDPQILMMEESVVTIQNHSSSQFTHKNLIIIGDRAGASSPLSGMGATLALSSYPVAVREFARALQEPSEQQRNQQLQEVNSFLHDSVSVWLDSARAAKNSKKVVTIRKNHPSLCPNLLEPRLALPSLNSLSLDGI